MIVAFFPILSNATLPGLRSVDPGLDDLFRLYRATRAQRLWLLQLPSALPALLAGARISAGLALIGAVVAEVRGRIGGRDRYLAYRRKRQPAGDPAHVRGVVAAGADRAWR